MTHDPMLETYKPGLQVLADLMHLSLANVARFHAQQLKLVNEALSDTAAAMKEIDAAKDLPGLLGVQARLGRAYFERSVGGWKELWEAAGQDQLEAFRQVQARMEQAGERFRDAAAGAPGEVAPAVAAMRSMLDAAGETYARSARAVEEMTRMVAAHAGAATHAES
jgi:phasin family protein